MRHTEKLVDMAKTPAEVKEDTADVPAAESKSKAVYPYGLCIRLQEDELEKLGLDGDLPSVGEMIHICAQARVTSVSESEREDSDGKKRKCCCVELQICEMGVPTAEAPPRKWYGGKGNGKADDDGDQD